MVVYCFAAIVGGGIAAGVTSGWAAAIAVVVLASIGAGGITWYLWPRSGT
jgi:hypothetical protein